MTLTQEYNLKSDEELLRLLQHLRDQNTFLVSIGRCGTNLGFKNSLRQKIIKRILTTRNVDIPAYIPLTVGEFTYKAGLGAII